MRGSECGVRMKGRGRVWSEDEGRGSECGVGIRGRGGDFKMHNVMTCVCVCVFPCDGRCPVL